MRVKRYPSRYLSAIVMLCTLGLFALCTKTYAQEKPESEAPASAEAEASESAEPKAESEAAEPEAGTEQPEAEGPAEPEKIPFSLKDAPIEQIVKFLSEKTGKAVLRNDDVKPKITIASPRPVTPEKAVELICQALRAKGVAVLEIDDLILLMMEKDLGKLPVTVIDATGKAPTVGIVVKVIQPRSADVTEIEKMMAPLLTEGVKLVADPRSGKIIITAPAQVLAGLEKVIAQIDVVEISETQIRIFQLQHAVAEEVAPILQAILTGTPGGAAKGSKGPPKPGQPSGGEDQVTVVAYKAANWIVVRATKEKLEAAEQLIAQLDKAKPPELELQVILLKHAQARDLAPRLSDLFRRRPRQKTIKDTVEIAAEQRSNALIILSSPSNFDRVKEIVDALDTEEARQRETRTYELEYADAEDAAEQLDDLYSRLSEYSYSYGDWSLWRVSSRSREPTA